MSMTAMQPQAYPAPFDAVAARYDKTFTSSLIGQAQRAAVWSELAQTFRSGDRVLEIGCGTGADACFLAERGVQVLALDASERMVEITNHKILERGLQRRVQTAVLSGEQLDQVFAGKLFDGAFSNFGVLNCVADLAGIARGLARLLRPGGDVLVCWMGPHCLWEMASYTTQGKRAKAFRRWKSSGVRARLAEGAEIEVHYPPVRKLAAAFAPNFRVLSLRGIGVAVPPSYLEPWAQRHPQWLRICERADRFLGRCPGVRLLGDHTLAHLQRRRASSPGGAQ